MSDERDAGPSEEPTEIEDETTEDYERSSRRGPVTRSRDGVWAFFHPPAAAWSAPGEQQARSAGKKLTGRLERSRGLQVAVAAGAVAVVVALIVAGWALWRPGPEAGEAGPGAESSAAAPSSEEAEELPGADAPAPGDPAVEEQPAETAEPAGEVADGDTLERINEEEDLVSSRAEDEQDPLVTGARFLRSLRTADTQAVEPADWYEARDSFVAKPTGGGQTDWGEAGERAAVSNAVVSWAEMDAGLEDGRGVAPEFPFGPEAAPGTHLVQAGMRLEREISAGDEQLDTPSGALFEAVVVCPPAGSVDRCVVTDWAEEPSGFVALADEAWEPSL